MKIEESEESVEKNWNYRLEADGDAMNSYLFWLIEEMFALFVFHLDIIQ